MSNFRNAQLQANPARINTLSLGIICVLVLVLIMQIWLLTVALNESLNGNNAVKWPGFWASVALFFSGAALIRYLPGPLRVPIRPVARESFRDAPLAWRTLAISTVSLALAFAVWFMWSAIPLRLNKAGFALSSQQLFWLTAVPVLLGSFLRIPYGLIVSTFGSRRSFAVVTLALLLPCVATGLAVRSPSTPYWVLLACAALTGIAGANFSTSMGVVNLWFPKQVQGTALGINGLGNLGVTIAQFAIPVVIGISIMRPIDLPASHPPLHLENAAFVWIPFVLLCAALIWFGTKDFPTEPKSLASQLAAGKRLHTWVLSTLYFLTFGCFVAMGASLPLIIHSIFAEAPGGAPNPLIFAPLAAAVATFMRPVGGWLADKAGAGLITSISLGTMALGGFSLSAFTEANEFPGFFSFVVLICAAAGLGNGSIFKIIPHVLPKEAGAAIGIVSCLGALGGFFPPLLLGWTMEHYDSPALAYCGMAAFALLCLGLNGWFYHRVSSESHC
ncbi:MAG: NarK/NasA family nitrate transporter [Chthoniobacterales bacterium]|nr:NarK/NasA family nitrate transporter [Chthoniobacterales bacterium]